ncbi:lytic transglycosylase domain-containing protein [Actinokineospora sp. G85]|uniref:lytic transglycosylase domain-containing protein n=1 Tax=Actinokineospora sp. G85 TaxID=3406626 RepID=UPI003C73FFF6
MAAGSSAEPAWPTVDVDLTDSSIPEVAMRAYARAEQLLRAAQPGCNVTWTLLAGLGKSESDHAQGGLVDDVGTTLSPILGPVLDGSEGSGAAKVPDTDGGRWDGDKHWDRAVGPMQFIPGVWSVYGTDGSGDGKADPNNLYDAAVTAARFLCAGGTDLNDPAQRARAVFRYNHSDNYVRVILTWDASYGKVVEQPTGIVPPPGAGVPDQGGVLAGGAQPAPLAAAGTTVAPQAGATPGGITVPPITVPGVPGVQVPGVHVPVPGLPNVPLPPAPAPPKPPTTTNQPNQPKPPTTTQPKPTTTAPKPTTTSPRPTTTQPKPTTTTPRPTTTSNTPNLPGTDWYDWTVWLPWNR